MDHLKIADKVFSSRLFMGTGKFGQLTTMRAAVAAAGSQLVTVALKRMEKPEDTERETMAGRENIIDYLQGPDLQILPNTSGARNAREAVFAAGLAREALQTNWIKLEVHPDPKYLMPDPVETLKAAALLVKEGFIVLPYIHADPVLCKRLEEIGTAAVMPLGAPIGSNLGLLTKDFLRIIIAQASVPVIVDAGIGRPSDAAMAMELGADAVLVNTAIATAGAPELMATAFKQAVIAGRLAFKATIASIQFQGSIAPMPIPSSPMTAFLDETY
ncbi:MAG TPA: thiazole synthase [Arachidicoccus sp.]|nr:thiazole synthase [Arachidicoccus sp.]